MPDNWRVLPVAVLGNKPVKSAYHSAAKLFGAKRVKKKLTPENPSLIISRIILAI